MKKGRKMKLKQIFLPYITLSLVTVCLYAQKGQTESTPQFLKEATLPCGKQPKQVLFSTDNKFIVLPLLDDKGFEVIEIAADATTQSHASKMINPPNAKKLGFAEGLFVPEKNAFFVSQMTTANIYEYTYTPGSSIDTAFTFKRTISTGGNWSKFIVWSHDKQLLAVSNWVSNDVSLIDYDSGKIVRMIKTAAAPRGLAFLDNGNEILVLCFDGGVIQKFNTQTGKLLNSISIKNSAMRHVVVNQTTAYISDMYHGSVYVIDLNTFTIIATWKVFNNPNTLALLDNKYLIVSSRGPNNPNDYTKRSLVDGKITIFDTTNGLIVTTLKGGNQPTGLAVSSDGKWMCFSNFQDANIELYKVK